MPNFTNKFKQINNHGRRRRLLPWRVWIYAFLFVEIISQRVVVDAAAIEKTIAATNTSNTAKATTPMTTSKFTLITAIMTKAPTKTTISSSTFIDRVEATNRNSVAFSKLEEKVVESLIKQWAPLVWLAPEEKFMPLGVEEFLNHVHPAEKSKNIIGGMPIGDNSKKAYLVTNAEIEELLENDNSFLYGRKPSETPVPIYAVVSVCNAPPIKTTPAYSTIHAYSEPQPFDQQLQSTRGPYIPVSLNPLDIRNNTVRRSSRLYPVFKKVLKRDVAHLTSSKLNMAMPFNTPGFRFEEESSIGPLRVEEAATTPETDTVSSSDTGQINNFIANLAHNVRFTGVSNEFDNTITKNDIAEPNQKLGISQTQIPAFHVTYWMFYPYSQGKSMCTLSLGPLGRIPIPAVYGFCLGRLKDIGSHIGDWEHMSLFFNGAAEPKAMYVSAHDAGAYYTYNQLTGAFEFKTQETRKGILQRPNFPKTVTTFNNHPVLFAAKGSHGLWTAPGKHRFVKVARLYDINGFGTPWNTWKAVDITYEHLKSYGRSFIPSWLAFKGKWGNPKSKCHPLQGIGLNFCEYTDGPTGIPLKEPHFQCDPTN